MGSHSLLQGILLTQGSKPDLVNFRQILSYYYYYQALLDPPRCFHHHLLELLVFPVEKRKPGGATLSQLPPGALRVTLLVALLSH